MGQASRTRRSVVFGLGLGLSLLGLSGCGALAAAPEQGVITLNVDIFGDQGFGYEELYPLYEKAHPKIKIKERGYGRRLGDLDTRLEQWLTSGAGAGDIVALEEGTIVKAKSRADKFVNLYDYGAASMKSDFLGWKWDQGHSADGKRLIGLGTDVGSLAMCYRKDIFARAGLPTDREQVGALWPTWDSYIATGRRFNAARPGASFVDSATNIFSPALMQFPGENTGYAFFDKSDKLVLDSNPDVRKAWDLTISVIDAKLSANLESWSEGWVTGFKQAQFATIACPAWMTGVIKGYAGDAAAGKWDVARAPGNGGNWGGSFLAVPVQSKHRKEAAELAKFLTSASSHLVAFRKTGNLPSSVKALDDPALRQITNPYFSNAPTGVIFGAGAKSLKPVYLGARTQAVRYVVEDALRSVEQGRRTPDAAWQWALVNGKQAAEAAK